MTFGEYIRSQGFTAKSLSEKAGTSLRNIEHYTTGQRPIKNATLEIASKLAAALGLHAEDLLQFDD